MRKLTALIMAIVFILLPLSAADLSETGVGSTREEAIAAADAALAQRIAMTTTSEMRTIRADDGSDSIDFMVINGRSFYSTEFLGSSFETEQLADGTWIATRTIPESSYRLYQKRLRESASIINDIYDSIELFGIDGESYTRIYSQLREYERNAVIVSMLRSNASIPEIPTNSVDIEAMYQSYLAESINATEQDVRRLEVQRELGIIGEVEAVYLEGFNTPLEARVDTGATTSSIDARNIRAFERDGKKWVSFQVVGRGEKVERSYELPVERVAAIKRHGAESIQRYTVMLTFRIGHLTLEREFTLSDRAKFQYPVLIGRNVITGIAAVDPSRRNVL